MRDLTPEDWDALKERTVTRRDALAQGEDERARQLDDLAEKIRQARADRDALREQVGIEVRSKDEWEANAERAEAQVDRVRALLDQYGPDHSPECGWEDCTRCVVNEVQRALDGAP